MHWTIYSFFTDIATIRRQREMALPLPRKREVPVTKVKLLRSRMIRKRSRPVLKPSEGGDPFAQVNPKSSGKMRPLSIPCMKDRAMQALYLLALDPIAEVTSDPNSYGFRQERSPADAIEQCFSGLSRQNCAQWILEGDIKSCFDQISHEWLLAHIPMEKAILKKWLKAGFIEKHVLHPTEEGTPQGGICSPVIANLALDGLERKLLERYPKPKTGYNAKVNYVRFADDFIVTGISKELLEQEIKPLIEQFLQERGLMLSQEKTVITHINDGFDFLGQVR